MDRNPHTRELLRERDAAALLCLAPATLRRWRSYGTGPRFSRLGKAIRYARSDLLAFVDANSVPHAAASTQGAIKGDTAR